MQSVRFTLRLNAATCAGFGLLFVIAAGSTSLFLGGFPEMWLKGIGLLLIFHSAHLLWTSYQASPGALDIYYFSIGDLLWFLGSLVLIALPGLITTSHGASATLAVALGVAVIGLAQLWTFAEATGAGMPSDTESEGYLPSDLSRRQALLESWLGIKTWVKIWLFALNGAFLGAFFFWSEPAAKVILLGYLATMPLLLAIMIVQRGLTRLLGLGHLITWIPLVIYLVGRLSSETFGPTLTFASNQSLYLYVVVLLLFLLVCLAFDIYDVIRWFKGIRSRLGSEAEVQLRMEQEASL